MSIVISDEAKRSGVSGFSSPARFCQTLRLSEVFLVVLVHLYHPQVGQHGLLTSRLIFLCAEVRYVSCDVAQVFPACNHSPTYHGEAVTHFQLVCSYRWKIQSGLTPCAGFD